MKSGKIEKKSLFTPKRVALALAMLLLLLLVALRWRPDSPGQGGLGALNRALAVVNGDEIMLDQFHQAYRQFLGKWDRVAFGEMANQEGLKEMVLDRMIEETLLDQEAKRLGISISEQELAEELDKVLSPGGRGMEERMELADKSMEEWVRGYRRRMVHEKLIRREVVGKIQVADAESRAYYSSHRAEFFVDDQVRVRHIAVENRQTFNKVAEQLAKGRDFVEMARKYSITPDRDNDGDLGFVKRGVMPPEFDKLIFRMEKIGEINLARPVETQIGFHLFKLEGRKMRQQMNYIEALPEIRQKLVREKQGRFYSEWLNGLKKKASIQVDRDLLSVELGV